MPRCSTPDTLVGVGEGGSRIVYQFMQQRWILDEVLKDLDDVGGERADELQAVTIDSAVDEGWHNEKASDVEDKIEEAVEDSPHRLQDMYLNFDGPHIVPEMISDEWKGPSLTSPKIEDFAEKNEMTSWWMEEGREPLQSINKKGFNGGVHRLRSLSKALYHITEYTDQDILPNRIGSEVCLVAALGGGTGSGMVIDLATELSERGATVNLFGIIPHDGSGGREKTNAHAALSEIEYAELAGESPFESVTLIPHTKEIEDQNKEFEMAVVRTILAQQQMSGSDTYLELLPNENDGSSAPGFAPFQVAVPHTVRFDLAVIDQAEDFVDEFLRSKREELRREADLHSVVKKYIQEAFEGTQPAEVINEPTKGSMKFRDGDGFEEAAKLRQRIEGDIIDGLLSQQALEIAITGQGDLIETIRDDFEETLDDERYPYSEDESTLERAVTFINEAPDRLLSELEDEYQKSDSEGRPYELIEALKQELENIISRRDIWKAVTAIDTNVEGIEEQDAKLIRRGLLDVTLNPEEKNLGSVIVNPTIKERVVNLRDEIENLRDRESDIEEFWNTVSESLREARNQWYQNSSDPAKRLTAINEDQDTALAALSELQSTIQDRVDAIDRAEQVVEVTQMTFNLNTMGPFDVDDDGEEQVSGVGPLNAMLEDMGVDQIPVNEIESRFEDLKQAKQLQLEHGDGFFGPDNTEDFPPAAVDAQRDGWFSINKSADTLDVTDEFEANFNSEKLDREGDIQNNRQEAIDEILDSFEQQFTESGSFRTFEDESVQVPESITSQQVKRELRMGLEDSTKTRYNDLLDDVMNVEPIESSTEPREIEDVSDMGSAMELIYEGYLEPIYDHYNDQIISRLENIGAEGEKTGVINRLEKVRGLAEGPRDVTISPPKKYEKEPQSETYGNTFANSYEGLYEIELDENLDYRESDNPYLSDEETNKKQMVGDPDHIGETEILENDPHIESDFRAAAVNIFESDGYAPFNNLGLQGAGNEEDPAYPHLRVRQAYLSRAFDTNTGMGDEFDEVHEVFAENVSQLQQDNDVYKVSKFGHGWDDDITMVSFVGGIFLDNISLLTQSGGYHDNYESSHRENSFIGSHHTIGMGGRWDKWEQMAESAANDRGSDSDVGTYGAFVYRDEIREPDQEFVEELLEAHRGEDQSGKDVFLDMLKIETYDSTFDLSD